MADLLLHDFLHLFLYDAAKMVRPLTSYTTKIATSAQRRMNGTEKEGGNQPEARAQVEGPQVKNSSA